MQCKRHCTAQEPHHYHRCRREVANTTSHQSKPPFPWASAQKEKGKDRKREKKGRIKKRKSIRTNKDNKRKEKDNKHNKLSKEIGSRPARTCHGRSIIQEAKSSP